MVLGALMACVAILVSALAKIGLAMAISFAPIFIASLLFNATRQLFEAWTRFTLGFALIPLVLAGVMGAVIGVGQSLVSTASGATEISQAAAFIIVVFAAVFMMYQIPSLVTGLAGSIVTTGTGLAEARAATRQAQGMANGAVGIATAPVRMGYSAAARSDAGKQASEAVGANGHGRVAQTAAFVTQAVRMGRDRQRFSDPSFLQRRGTLTASTPTLSNGNGGGGPNGPMEAMKAASAVRARQAEAIQNQRRTADRQTRVAEFRAERDTGNIRP